MTSNPAVTPIAAAVPPTRSETAPAAGGGESDPAAGDGGSRPDVAAYLDRIGVAPGPPDTALLRRIVRAHVATIPFENLDPFTGTEPPVDRADIVGKLVHGRRGGWCFENNRLLHDMLGDLGYRVTPLVGRVRLGVADGDPPTMRTHRLTLVEAGDPAEGTATTAPTAGFFVVDVGFGGTVPSEPLRLVSGTVQPTAHAEHRYRSDGAGGWAQQRRGGGDWLTQYTFDLTPVPDIDYAMGSWYLTHHPASHFRNGLIAAYSGPDRRATLAGNRYTLRHTDGRTEERELSTPARVIRALEDEFGIDTSGVSGLEQRIRTVHFG
ncbi:MULTISPECIES: arylamine N-acetyltransferase family protein [Pseudonocardia]|uniref:Arylamine N-acetyltransferase n=2 Tax=Pseudonocardia TaxID=1847 RepID=A0A1Y2MV65_PSEAH|nr:MULTISPECIES: arylamine N-acetyltransferase [Pseudonocardia]OSY39074.1 Arylamine N-acetyltransferase [Pseudonocardia autotrophica]TDN71330.1 arylamine N-acetyltransferase/N-hydroxyarylamine O-acetyltransferase [Pseudonocardia autotrophica]